MQSNKSLQNKRILITRSEQRAKTLVDAVISGGGTPILLPTISILSLEYSEPVVRILKHLHEFDIAIFVSPNAVIRMPVNHLRIIAIGVGTRDKLQQYAVKVDDIPQHFSTEGLLELAVLQEVAAKRILIFCAEGGRLDLAEILRQRGAEVTLSYVYSRRCPKLDLHEQASDWQKQGIDVIVGTSGESLYNLLQMVGAFANWLKQLPCLVVSQRVANIAKALGFVMPPIIAANASNEAIFKALCGMTVDDSAS